MKIVINRSWGGFGFTKKVAKELGALKYEKDDGKRYYYVSEAESYRTSPKLMELIEKWGSKRVSGEYANLVIKEIPDEATDYMIQEYDGMETLYYVLNGKICKA